MVRWKTVQLPQDLVEEIDKLVEETNLGFTSRAEFIRAAVRAYLKSKGKTE